MRPESLAIRKLASDAEAQRCARMMASSEPWITVGRGYEASLDLFRNPDREVYVAESTASQRAGTTLGFIILNMQGAFVGYIQTICVDPEMRSAGIGSLLVAFAEERILRETPNVFLCVSSFNSRARALYERLGYEVIGELKDYLVAGASEILMRKSVGPLMSKAARL